MKVVKPQRLALLTRTYEYGPDCFLSVAIVLFFPFESSRSLLTEVELWKFTSRELGKDAALDACMPKTRAEFLIGGCAYLPGGTQAVVCAPRAQVGQLDKTLRVTGDRFWKDGVPSAPEPFGTMPITWDRAFGGPSHAFNPLGRGADILRTERGEFQPLPNIEDPDAPIRSPSDRPPPAGFGPYDLTWPQRMRKAGTHDEAWVKTRSPGFAGDIDWTFFNVAPDDQQMEGPFRGDEAFLFDFMHPEKIRVEGRLPGAIARCHVNMKGPAGDEFREIPTKLDTLWLFPHAERGVAVYHGATKVAEDDAADVLQIVVGCEEMGVPRPAEHYARVLAKRLDREEGATAALCDRDLMPDWPGAADPPASEGAPPVVAGLVEQNQRKRARLELERLRVNLGQEGVDASPLLALQEAWDEHPPSAEEIPERAKKMRKESEALEQQMEAQRASLEEDLRRELAAQGLDPGPMLEQARHPVGGPPTFSAESELRNLRDLSEELARAGMDPGPVAAMVADAQCRERFVAAERQLRENYRLTAHAAPPARALDRGASGPLREEVLTAVRAGESLEGRDLTGADLSGIQLAGANLAGAFLECADLSGADLSGADLSNAVLARANLSSAGLRGARLCSANLGSAILREADLAEADFTEAILIKADLSRASLKNAVLTQADLSEASFGGADLSGIRAAKLVLIKTDLSGLRLTGADLSHGTFLEVVAEGTDFSEARLTSAVFLGARAHGAVFQRGHLRNLRLVQECSFEKADFSDADLEGANLRGSKLAGCDFSRARLSGADLSECDLRLSRFDRAVAREARFVKADLDEVVLTGANLMGAVMQKAKLPGADLEGASLYQADLARVLSDDRTKFAGANMKKVRLDPKRVR